MMIFQFLQESSANVSLNNQQSFYSRRGNTFNIKINVIYWIHKMYLWLEICCTNVDRYLTWNENIVGFEGFAIRSLGVRRFFDFFPKILKILIFLKIFWFLLSLPCYINKQSTAQVNQVLGIGILQFLSNWANPKNLGTILIACVLQD